LTARSKLAALEEDVAEADEGGGVAVPQVEGLIVELLGRGPVAALPGGVGLGAEARERSGSTRRVGIFLGGGCRRAFGSFGRRRACRA
jgi:hypothetical protein